MAMFATGKMPTSDTNLKYQIVVNEVSQNTHDNYTVINVVVRAWRTNQAITYGSGTCYLSIDSNTYSQSITSSQVIRYWNPTNNDGSPTTLFNRNFTIYHTMDGTKTISVKSRIDHQHFSSTNQGFPVTLTPIPRIPTLSVALGAKTETSVTISWTTDIVVDLLSYSMDGGTNYTFVSIAEGTSGTYTISSLTANTEYEILTKARSKDSLINSSPESLTITTYRYPYANSMPNFQIGTSLTVGIFNPLGRSVTVTMIGADNTEYGSIATAGTAVSGFNDAGWITWLYSTIPSTPSATYKIKVTYGSINSTETGGTYSINPADCRPSITGAAYEDTNATTLAVTGDDQKIVRNLSTVLYTASGLSAQRGASVESCTVTVNDSTYSLTVSGSGASGGGAVIDSAQDVEAVFTVTDSRGVSSSMSITISMLDWVTPTAIITLNRKDNFYSETYIKVDADYSYLDGQNSVTITYKARKVGETSYSITGTLQDNVQDSFTADNNYEWEVVVTIVDIFNGTVMYNLYLSRGTPIIYFDRIKSSVGINCFPQGNNSFEVNGLTIIDIVYPVNSIYLSIGSTSPQTLFGGTWSSIGTFTIGSTTANAWKRTA